VKLPRLYVVMLRYRVAAMVAIFMLLGAAREGRLELGVRHVWAALALASSYVAATALNDLADEQVDRVNHPRKAGRPLVEGTASRTELLVLHVLSSLLAVVAAVPLGWRALAWIAAGLAISQLYSARPVRLSYRLAGAPVALGIAYVVIPYSLGIVAARGRLRDVESALVVALFLLFTARILLKDFRDREGDARYGKPTLLLRFGKRVTCGAILVALLAADVVLAFALDVRLALLLQPFVAAIAWMLRRLWLAREQRSEQVAIGLGARVGNGLLLSVLAWSVLDGSGASAGEGCAFTATLSAAFLLSFAALAAEPQHAIIGYKG
jgi:1,4-dihydroxy-2-naphthoate polyprenyltransferase